jgi:two-component system KDP operon response regulator KdpE
VTASGVKASGVTSDPGPSVLVVDDEVQIRRFLRAGFELDGYVVHDADSGADALRAATLRPFDLIILDLALPDLDGSEVLERIRAWSDVPVIVLSVRSHEGEKVRLLELGADDYVVKPFGMAELTARAKAALRRHKRGPGGDSVLMIERLRIDFAARQVSVDGKRLILTPKEYRLLQVLARHIGKVVTHQNLLTEVWGQSHLHDTHYLRIFVRKLRRKIEADPTRPRILLTELGVGYRLALPAETAPQALSS